MDYDPHMKVRLISIASPVVVYNEERRGLEGPDAEGK
jgi:hypothetical protein